MRPDYDRIRELEHECGIGLPHDDCWDCDTAGLYTPLPRLQKPKVTRTGGQVHIQYVSDEHKAKHREKWDSAIQTLLRAAR